MNKCSAYIGLTLLLITAPALGGVFNLHRGDLLDTDKIDIEWRKQFGICNTKFPVESAECEYFNSNVKGLNAIYIDTFSQNVNFNTENTFLLNVALNGIPLSSCQMVQQKIIGFSLVTINKEGCIIS